MNKNKGFTLIELLAVIVILGILLLVAIPSITNVTKNSDKKAFIVDAQMFLNAAKNYKTTSNSDEKKISYTELKNEEYLESEKNYKGVVTFNNNKTTVILCGEKYCIEDTDVYNLDRSKLVENKFELSEITDEDLYKTVIKNRAIEFVNKSLKYYNDNYKDEGKYGYTNYTNNTVCINYSDLINSDYNGRIILKQDGTYNSVFQTKDYYVHNENSIDYNSFNELKIDEISDNDFSSCENIDGYNRREITKEEVLSKIINLNNYNTIEGNNNCLQYKDDKYFSTINSKTNSIRSYVELENGFYLVSGNYSDGLITDITDYEYKNSNVTLKNINLGSIKYYNRPKAQLKDTFGCIKK